ncbi:TerD family protein [Streptacidiphilus carbonis]|uniref:TerD family protein n=1 Tax=Streptacidiphilus carbonis TaxID=105422 RepID=UPI0005AB5A2C|nr:TerD family protein [Streptacidiphilus carbonis]
MTAVLTPGGNTPLTSTRVSVEVAAAKLLDVSALLLTTAGKVRSDNDLIFFNAPSGPGVSYSQAGISVDTGGVPADIDKIVITASLDDQHATFAGTEPTATVKDSASGTVLATFTPPRLTTETALIVVELYRRGAEWKLRAVGQGYASGLAGIATDFGISVEEEPAAAPAAQPASVRPPQPEPDDWHLASPTPTPAPAADPAPAAAAPVGPAKITLDKGRVSLTKGGSVSLVKDGKPFLSSVKMGLGWEPAHRGRAVDLDASVIAFDSHRKELEKIYFMHLQGFNGAIQHMGDNLTGAGSGDDEVITVHLQSLPPQVTGLVFTVNSFSGQKFTDVAKAYCRLIDANTNAELVRFDLTHAEPRTGVMICKLIRMNTGEWVMTALEEYEDAKSARGMVKPASKLL